MLIPIHVAFLDLLDGEYHLVFGELVRANGDFAQDIKTGVYALDNLSLVLGISKRRLMKQLKLGMKHPDIPNDKRGLVKRKRGQDGENIDVLGLSYDILDMIKFYQMEKLSSKINNIYDRDIFQKLLHETDLEESDPSPENGDELDEDWTEHADIMDDDISSLADYYGELTENHYGAQAIGHSMPSEKNINLQGAMIKIIKRCTLLYRLALNDSFNIQLPMGGPNPFWLGVIMHTITDSYSTVHTYRVRYDIASGLYYKLSTNLEKPTTSDIVDPKFEDFRPVPGQLHFSRWELQSPLSLFARCLSNYLDHHFNEFYAKINTFDDPESLIDYVVTTICRNYCSSSPESHRVFCRTCERSYSCRTFQRLKLFEPSEQIPDFDDYYISTDLRGEFYQLEKFGKFVNGYHKMGPGARKVREKVIELVNRLLFFKFREKELNTLFQNPSLKKRYENMIEDSYRLDNYSLDTSLPVQPEEEIDDPDSGYVIEKQLPEPDLVDISELESEKIILQNAGDGLWSGFVSTVNDLLARGQLRLKKAITLEQFKYYDQKEIYRNVEARRQNQSFIIDFHDYEQQTDPPDTHMRCDYVQDPSLLREIYYNLKHLTELYSHHVNYLYKLKIKKGQNINNTFYDEHGGDIRQLGDDPEYAKEEYETRLRKCLKEFYHFLYYWVYRISSPEAARSRIKRFRVNPKTCKVE